MSTAEPTDPCPCRHPDPALAEQALRQAAVERTLVDESHFMASVRRCPACAQLYLWLFCECVDWADSDDPQSRVIIPISDAEARSLSPDDAARDEASILRALPGSRRLLFKNMPKSAPDTTQWLTRAAFIPAHD